ncbi:MAG TPA: hypothetical protein VN417_04980 [Candidatus Cryosericum sp.]|nr:hypothetical protein [Candidatus Cryosericum sp.]
MKRLIARVLPHITIILGLLTLVFFVVDGFNPIMAFMSNELSKKIFAVLAVCGIASAVLLIARQWQEDDRRARKLARQQRKQELLAEETEKSFEEEAR